MNISQSKYLVYQVESSPSIPVLVIYFLTFSKEHFHDLQINIFNIFKVLESTLLVNRLEIYFTLHKLIMLLLLELG